MKIYLIEEMVDVDYDSEFNSEFSRKYSHIHEAMKSEESAWNYIKNYNFTVALNGKSLGSFTILKNTLNEKLKERYIYIKSNRAREIHTFRILKIKLEES